MTLQERIALLDKLGSYMLSDAPAWVQAKEMAGLKNGWFIPEFVEKATRHIASAFLQAGQLQEWVTPYQLPDQQAAPKRVGLVMAGNIPLVGFHDWLSVFISGHHAAVKLSSKDEVLMTHLLQQVAAWSSEAGACTTISEMVKGCDAYIATGSNNSAGYFDYYFGKYPNIIRRNRTSVAVLRGDETVAELEALADDVHLYFGLGCRNVTKLYVPAGYDFAPLLSAFRRYLFLADHHKYKNNYDYNLALLMLNKQYYMSNESILLVENEGLFSPISQLHYTYYESFPGLMVSLKNNQELQCIVGKGEVAFGQSQFPAVNDYADGADTLQFLSGL